MEKVAVISANLGGFDKPQVHAPQSIPCDMHVFTDANFPPRYKAMTPRLQAKIPKCFAWQLVPNYDYYIWIDGNFDLSHPDSVKWLVEHLQNSDVVVLRHPNRRNTVKWEARYVERALNEQSRYMVGRYDGEWLKEQMNEINSDKDFMDDSLVIAGIFAYRNIPAVQKMLKEWWYHISRYLVMDQMSFNYILKKGDVRVKILEEKYYESIYFHRQGHQYHSK